MNYGTQQKSTWVHSSNQGLILYDAYSANSHQRDYLPVAGLPELREDIATWASATLRLNYSRDDVVVGPGTKELLFVLQTVYYGDLLLPNPSCTSYAPQANIAGRLKGLRPFNLSYLAAAHMRCAI